MCPRGMNVPLDCLCLARSNSIIFDSPFLTLPHAVDNSSRLFYVVLSMYVPFTLQVRHSHNHLPK